MENWEIEKEKDLPPDEIEISDPIINDGPSRVSTSVPVTKPPDKDEVLQEGNRRRSSVVEWNPEVHGQPKLSLTISENEREIFVEDVRDKSHTLLDKDCVSEDVLKIWTIISQYIIKKMKDGYGVQIPGLCTITYQIEKVDVKESSIYFELIKTPIMIMSPQVMKMYKLRQDLPLSKKVKSIPLNLTEISEQAGISRRIVEGVVTELLQAFVRAVVCNKRVEFPFPYIGKLQVQNRKATMKFYEEFYTKMGFNLPESYLNPENSASTNTEEEKTKDEKEQILPGRMTPLRKHIPTDTYRSVFHLREVRSVHDGELLVEPLELIQENKCHEKHRKISINEKQRLSIQQNLPESERHGEKVRSKSIVSVNSQDSLNDEEKPYMWNPKKKYWIDGCGNPVTYIASPLYEPQKSGKFMIDATLENKNLFMDTLYNHHHSICCRILGMDTVLRHLARRDKIAFPPLSYENMHYNPPLVPEK